MKASRKGLVDVVERDHRRKALEERCFMVGANNRYSWSVKTVNFDINVYKYPISIVNL